MKTIELTTWERAQLLNLVGSRIAGRGTYADVRLGCKALDVLEFSEEEKREVAWVEFPEGRITWRPNEAIWTLEFADNVWDFLKKRGKAYRDWPIGRLTNALLDKMGIENEDD